MGLGFSPERGWSHGRFEADVEDESEKGEVRDDPTVFGLRKV